jgi:1-acyl-sn-glycerol-3-phosphate acyltransferase
MERLRAPIARAIAERGFVHFFPEGRLRPRRTDVAGFQDGVFLLSVVTGIPVIPIVVVAERRTLLRRPASFLPPRISVVVGRPLAPERFRRAGARPRECAADMNRAVRSAVRSILGAAAGGSGPRGRGLTS